MYSVIAFDGQVYGPVDIRTLIAWCQQGRIVASTHLVETQTGRSFTAADMPELRAVLAQAQPVGPQAYVNPQGGPGAPYQAPYQPQGPDPGQGPIQAPYQPQGQAPNQGPFGMSSYPRQVPYGAYGSYGAPKSKSLALLLCFLVGGLGAHRFYLGHTASAIAMLIVGLLSCGNVYFLGIALIWGTIDFIRLASGTMADSQGVLPR